MMISSVSCGFSLVFHIFKPQRIEFITGKRRRKMAGYKKNSIGSTRLMPELIYMRRGLKRSLVS